MEKKPPNLTPRNSRLQSAIPTRKGDRRTNKNHSSIIIRSDNYPYTYDNSNMDNYPQTPPDPKSTPVYKRKHTRKPGNPLIPFLGMAALAMEYFLMILLVLAIMLPSVDAHSLRNHNNRDPYNYRETRPYFETGRNGNVVIFNKIGSTSDALAWGIIRREIDVEELRIFATAAIKLIKEYQDDLYAADQAHDENMMSLMTVETFKLDRFAEWFAKVAGHNTRTKRFAGLILKTAVTVGTSAIVSTIINNIFNNQEIANLDRLAAITDRNLKTLDKRTKAAFNQTDTIAFYLQKATKVMGEGYHTYLKNQVATLLYTVLQRNVADIEDIFTAAIHGNVHPTLLRNINLEEMARDIRNHADQRGLRPVFQHNADILQYPASFTSVKGNKYNFHVQIHVPLIRANSFTSIYRFIPMPMRLGPGRYILLQPANNLRMLGVNQARETFTAFTDMMFLECHKSGQFYACPRGNVARVYPDFHGSPDPQTPRDPEICLIALFLENHRHAEHHCDKVQVPATELAYQIGPESFVIYTSEPHQAVTRCSNSSISHQVRQSIRDTDVITVPAGCYAQTDHHTLTASDQAFEKDLDQWRVQYTWPYNPNSLLAHIRKSNGTGKLAQEMTTIHSQVSQLRGEWDNFTKDDDITYLRGVIKTSSSTWRRVGTWIAIIGIPILIATVLLFAFVLYYKGKKIKATIARYIREFLRNDSDPGPTANNLSMDQFARLAEQYLASQQRKRRAPVPPTAQPAPGLGAQVAAALVNEAARTTRSTNAHPGAHPGCTPQASTSTDFPYPLARL